MSFAEKLQSIRKEKGLSQENLAERIGISRQAVAKWELGQCYPDVEKLVLLSNLFKVSIDKLVKDIDDTCCSCLEKDQELISDNNNDTETLIEFLLRAKRATYAGKGAEAEASRPNSHDFIYSETSFKYIDTYLGGEKFAGEEAVWKENIPVWSMNYFGRILDEGFSGDFLKEALFLASKEYPYRGPMVYQNGDYIYHCIINGEFDWFQGYEEIFWCGKKVYECFFQGGTI